MPTVLWAVLVCAAGVQVTVLPDADFAQALRDPDERYFVADLAQVLGHRKGDFMSAAVSPDGAGSSEDILGQLPLLGVSASLIPGSGYESGDTGDTGAAVPRGMGGSQVNSTARSGNAVIRTDQLQQAQHYANEEIRPEDCKETWAQVLRIFQEKDEPIAEVLARLRAQQPPGAPKTDGFCHFGVVKASCTAARRAGDYLLFAKTWSGSSAALQGMEYEGYQDIAGFSTPPGVNAFGAKYCHDIGALDLPGWLLYNFSALKEQGEGMCRRWNHLSSQVTIGQLVARLAMDQAHFRSDYRLPSGQRGQGMPSEYSMHFHAASNCAMGDLSCDLASCMYNYCRMGNGQVGQGNMCRSDWLSEAVVPGVNGATGSAVASGTVIREDQIERARNWASHEMKPDECKDVVSQANHIISDYKAPIVEAMKEVQATQGLEHVDGFCWYGIVKSSCSLARRRQDYMIYASTWSASSAALSAMNFMPYTDPGGFTTVKGVEAFDAKYCHDIGALDLPMWLLQNFTALQKQAERMCDRWSLLVPHITMEQMLSHLSADKEAFLSNYELPISMRPPSFPNEYAMQFHGATSCALGDLGCDVAYCMYNYCRLPGGRIGQGLMCREDWLSYMSMDSEQQPTRAQLE